MWVRALSLRRPIPEISNGFAAMGDTVPRLLQNWFIRAESCGGNRR